MIQARIRTNLWTAAFDSLKSDDKCRLQKYHTEKTVDSIDDTLKTVQETQSSCLQKRWTVKTKYGHRIIIRDILDKIAHWLNKFKEIGDAVAQYDTAHASLPWTVVRVLLHISINDLETFASVAEGLETLARLVARYSIFEAVYLPEIGERLTTAQSKLCDALVLLYADLLIYLIDIGRYYERSTGTRVLRSLFELSDRLQNPLEAALAKEEEVEKIAQMVQADVSRKMDVSIRTIEENSSRSFISLESLLRSLEAPISHISDSLALYQDFLEVNQRRKLLTWLSGHSYREHHESVYKGLVPGTTEWIFSNPQFLEWQRSSACSILWLHGIPGCGKTKLTSSIIQRLQDMAAKNAQSAPVAYAYCSNTNNVLPNNPLTVLRSILRQLAMDCHCDKIRKPVWEEFIKRQKTADLDGSEPSSLNIEECREILLAITLDCPAIIVLDGLDEIDVNRVELMTVLRDIINRSGSVVKVLISSREEADIEQELQNDISVPISPAEISSDIARYVQCHVDLAIADRKLLGGRVSETLKCLLIKTLNEGAGGMFLWPALQLKYLCDRRAFKLEADVIAALRDLPPDLMRTFEKMYSRVYSYGRHGAAVAIRIFAWLLSSQRPLLESELITAVNSPRDESAELNSHDTQTVIDLCCNFVTVDKCSGCFIFVHASVREYLEKLPEYTLSMVNFTAAQRCLEYFMFDEDDNPDCSFRQYAICNWAHHYLNVADATLKPKLEILLITFASMEERPTFQLWLEDVKNIVEAKSIDASKLKDLNTLLNEEGSPVFLGCVYGIPLILETVEADAARIGTNVDWNAKNAHGTPMLYISARYGRSNVVSFLLSRGAKVDVDGGLLGNPLQGAAFYGHEEAARILIEYKANLLASGKFPSALEAAMKGGHEPAIKMLFEASNITKPAELEKVLMRASYDGHYEMVTRILELLAAGKEDGASEADPSHIHNALQMALFQCRPRIAKRMIKSVPNTRVNTGHFGNALQAAAFGGHVTMVTMVLDHGADVNCPGRFGTPLRAAALRGHDTVVRLLIDQGAGVEGHDANALQAAAFHGHLSTVRLLLDSGLYGCGDYSSSVSTAVEVAAFRGHREVVDLLLQTYGSEAAYAAFSAALDGGQEVIVRLALEREPRIRDSDEPDGSNILCSAGGALELLPELSEPETSLSTSEDVIIDATAANPYSHFNGRLPWLDSDMQSLMGSDAMARSIESCGDISLGNGRLLRMAARKGYVDVIRHLIDQGNDINTTGNSSGPLSGQSLPIEVASAAGQAGVVEYLLKMGAKVGKALSYAVRSGSLEVIHLTLRERPEVSLDEPVLDDSLSDHWDRGYTSEGPISVAIEWEFGNGLEALLEFGRNRAGLMPGKGLVVATRKRDYASMRRILDGVALVGDTADDGSALQCYMAFVVAAKQAALNRDIDAMRILLEHTKSIPTQEKILVEVVRYGIVESQWYSSLLETKVLAGHSCYERLAGQALIALAADEESRHFRIPSYPEKERLALWKELGRISETSTEFAASYQDAFLAAAKSGNLQFISILLKKNSGQYSLHIGDMVPEVNSPDEHENTALYYACMNGNPKLFNLLVENGAVLSSMHATVPSQILLDNGRRAEAREGKVNLLQIALDSRQASERYGTAYCVWETPIRDTWGPIVLHLLEAGLELDLHDPALVKFLHISCFQGELIYVQRLLAQGVTIVGTAGNGREGGICFGSALHAAVFAGQKAVVECLIEHGADVQLKVDCLEAWYLENKTRQSAIEAALKERSMTPPTSEDSVLESCAYLIDHGASEEDAEALLHAACKHGNAELAKRLLQRGTVINQPPRISDCRMYELLASAGYRFPPDHDIIREMQSQAIEEGNVNFLSALVNDYGLRYKFAAFRDAAWDIIRSKGDKAAIIQFLIDNCSFHLGMVYWFSFSSFEIVDSELWDVAKRRKETILYQAACLECNPEVVAMLLQMGAHPDSPGLPRTPLMSFMQKVHGGGITADEATSIVKLFLDHGADPDGARDTDREQDGTLQPTVRVTPLILAVASTFPAAANTARLLIEKGADLNHGKVSPLHLAYFRGNHKITNLLLQHGAVDRCNPSYTAEGFVRDLRHDDENEWEIVSRSRRRLSDHEGGHV